MLKISQTTRLWLVSLTAISVVVLGTILLVAFAQGYSYDPINGQVRSSGLVLIDSKPNSASISVNGVDFRKKTPYRYTNAPAGTIRIDLQKDQYRNWSAQENVTAGEVTFADYAFLLPNILQQQSIAQPQPYTTVVQSADNSHTIALAKSPLVLLALNTEGESKELYKPVSQVDPQKQVVDIDSIQVSRDGARVLFRQKLASGAFQKIVVETSNNKVDNLTEEFGLIFDDLRFGLRDSAELFWLETGVVKKVRVNERSISANLINNVASLSIASDRLLVVQTLQPPATTQQLVSYSYDGNDKKDITGLAIDPLGYSMNFIHSRYDEYVTVVHSTSGILELIKDPYSSHQSVTQLGDKVTTLTVSANGRFLVINQDQKMRTIDLEFAEHYNFDTSLEKLEQWSWYDEYHLVLRQNGQLRLVDFDGQNNQLLTNTTDVIGVSIQPDHKTVLPLNTNGKLFKLYLIKK